MESNACYQVNEIMNNMGNIKTFVIDQPVEYIILHSYAFQDGSGGWHLSAARLHRALFFKGGQ